MCAARPNGGGCWKSGEVRESEFDAVDPGDHLAEALDNPQYRQALRAARTDSQLYEAARALPPPREDVSRSA